MQLASEALKVIATIDPQTVANTQATSDVVDMSKFNQVLFIFATGDMASETIDARVEYCDSDGSNAAALKSATQLTASATANDNSQIVISVKAEDLIDAGKRYVRGRCITGGASGGPMACVAVGIEARHSDVADLASVAEIVTAND